jgi:hypothetical protein
MEYGLGAKGYAIFVVMALEPEKTLNLHRGKVRPAL